MTKTIPLNHNQVALVSAAYDGPPEPEPAPKRPAFDDFMHRWAQRYDELNGQPESDEDR